MPESRKSRILLTNDDGVRASGLRAAYEALQAEHAVTVVAPSEQKSGASHTITLNTPLRAKPLSDYPGYRVDFTPADCVKLGLRCLLPERPDLVVSGINRGPNGGPLVHYSGTVAAAKEAAMQGVPAIAFSLCDLECKDYSAAAQVTAALVGHFLAHPHPADVVLNVNVPPLPYAELKGIRWRRQSGMRLADDYVRRLDPRERPYYWLTATGSLDGLDPDDDLSAVAQGYVTITPLRIDWTDAATLAAGRDLDGLL